MSRPPPLHADVVTGREHVVLTAFDHDRVRVDVKIALHWLDRIRVLFGRPVRAWIDVETGVADCCETRIVGSGAFVPLVFRRVCREPFIRAISPLLLAALLLAGCFPRYVARDADAYVKGETAVVARQVDASAALHRAVDLLQARTPEITWEECADLIRPALEIDARAVAQSHRSLAAARGEPDPGIAPQAASPETVCGLPPGGLILHVDGVQPTVPVPPRGDLNPSTSESTATPSSPEEDGSSTGGDGPAPAPAGESGLPDVSIPTPSPSPVRVLGGVL